MKFGRLRAWESFGHRVTAPTHTVRAQTHDQALAEALWGSGLGHAVGLGLGRIVALYRSSSSYQIH